MLKKVGWVGWDINAVGYEQHMIIRPGETVVVMASFAVLVDSREAGDATLDGLIHDGS